MSKWILTKYLPTVILTLLVIGINISFFVTNSYLHKYYGAKVNNSTCYLLSYHIDECGHDYKLYCTILQNRNNENVTAYLIKQFDKLATLSLFIDSFPVKCYYMKDNTDIIWKKQDNFSLPIVILLLMCITIDASTIFVVYKNCKRNKREGYLGIESKYNIL